MYFKKRGNETAQLRVEYILLIIDTENYETQFHP